MTPAEIGAAILTLSADLQDKLYALPSSSTVAEFSPTEQSALTTAFGANWATILGIG